MNPTYQSAECIALTRELAEATARAAAKRTKNRFCSLFLCHALATETVTILASFRGKDKPLSVPMCADHYAEYQAALSAVREEVAA